MNGRLIVPLVLMLLVVPVSLAEGSDAATTLYGYGHGDGIDVSYSSDDGYVVIELTQKPKDYVTFSFVSATDEQTVFNIEPQMEYNIDVATLKEEQYLVFLVLESTGALVAQCDMFVSSDIVLFYSSAGGTGTMTPTKADDSGKVTIASCTFTPPGSAKFSHWSINGTSYQPGQTITITKVTEAVAVWDGAQFTVAYDANGGSGSMPTAFVDYGSTITLSKCSFSAPEGKSFDCWTIDGKEYDAGDSYKVTGNTLVMAKWTSSSGDDSMMIIIAAVIVILVLIVAVVLLMRRKV